MRSVFSAIRGIATVAAVAAGCCLLAACGSTTATSPPTSSATTAPPTSAPATSPPDSPSATVQPTSPPTSPPDSPPATTPATPPASAVAGPTVWCSPPDPLPATISPNLQAWLLTISPGYGTMQSIKGTLNHIFDPKTPAATLQQLGSSLCHGILTSEAAPPPAEFMADYTAAMKSFGEGSYALHQAPSSSAIAQVRGAVTKFNVFMRDIGKPPYSG